MLVYAFIATFLLGAYTAGFSFVIYLVHNMDADPTKLFLTADAPEDIEAAPMPNPILHPSMR